MLWARFFLAGLAFPRGFTTAVTFEGHLGKGEEVIHTSNKLPYCRGGGLEKRQEHLYDPEIPILPHTAEGSGLSTATTGSQASFTIQLSGMNESEPQWGLDSDRFIYVWIASKDHVFTAEVEYTGDGILTVTYESSFPGVYRMYIEDIDKRVKEKHLRGRPIVGSPFLLNISGEPSFNVDVLPVCGTEEEDITSMYWRPGSWISANLASAEHGVLRDGWVFQPKKCVHDTFSYDDLMLLASLEEPTWILVLGNSVFRGVFLTLVDMLLAQGQKDNFATSAIQKCWGFADIRVGNLRLTYQDFRLYDMISLEDSTICNDEKLKSGSTAAYVESAKLFFERTVFQDGAPWPSLILTVSNMVDRDEFPNMQINVVIEALPAQWNGTVVVLDHFCGYWYCWTSENPTLTALDGVKPVNKNSVPSGDHGIKRMDRFRNQDSRMQFISAFPMYQAMIFENQESRNKGRCYGCSIHYHFVSKRPSGLEAFGGSQMVHSVMTEMVANMVVSKAVGTKAGLHKAIANTPDIYKRKVELKGAFEMCTDCPSALMPHHVKPVPEPVCKTLKSLPGDAPVGKAWDNELCPNWCLATDPVGQILTGSGMADVRVCESSRNPH